MITVSIASERELEDIIELFHRIEVHYFPETAPTRTEISKYVRSNLFQPHCGVQVAIAREGARPLGIATFAILYPAPGMSGQLFMKDLFTVSEARGKGVGKAIEFYDRLGVPRVKEKVYYRLTKEKLRSFAEDEA